MDVLGMRRQGWSINEIAHDLGYHPATVSKWLKTGGPPAARTLTTSERVVDGRWGKRIAELIEPPSRLLSTSVFEIISAEGFCGSYPSVVRAVRELRGPRFRPAPQVSVPIETAPGEECQFDFSDCAARGQAWGISESLWCFGAVACWSRYLFWWFTDSVDRQHTFEGLVRAFETLGGVTQLSRTDRMGALGTSQGRRLLPAGLDGDAMAVLGEDGSAGLRADAERRRPETNCPRPAPNETGDVSVLSCG